MVCVSPQGWVARSKHRLAEFVSCLSVCRSDIYEPVLAVLYVLFLIKPASWSQLVCIVQIFNFGNWKLFFLCHSCLSISILWVSKDTEAYVCLYFQWKNSWKHCHDFSHPHVIPSCMPFLHLWNAEVLYHLWVGLFHTGFDQHEGEIFL